jgi:hypothetical protein
MCRWYAGFLRRDRGFERAAFGEDPIGVVGPDVLVELDQVDVIGDEPIERGVQLLVERVFRAPVELRHEEHAVAISRDRERPPHP